MLTRKVVIQWLKQREFAKIYVAGVLNRLLIAGYERIKNEERAEWWVSYFNFLLPPATYRYRRLSQDY